MLWILRKSAYVADFLKPIKLKRSFRLKRHAKISRGGHKSPHLITRIYLRIISEAQYINDEENIAGQDITVVKRGLYF